MTAIDYAALVERAKNISPSLDSTVDVLNIIEDMIKSLERLTQTAGVEPFGCIDGPDGSQVDVFSSETVARLQAERDGAITEILSLQEQVKAARLVATSSVRRMQHAHVYCDDLCKDLERLAATEPKEKTE